MVSDGGFFMRGKAAGIPAAPDPSVVASGPTGPDTWGWDFDGSYGDWYGGHELGHTFGRKHPGFCGETQDDLDGYPFAGGSLADAEDSFCGFDVGDPLLGVGRSVLPGLDWHDVMTYCDQEWLSPYTYQAIRSRLLAEDALGSLPAAGPVPVAVSVVAAGPTAAPAPAEAVPAEAGAAGGAGGRPDGRVGVAGPRVEPSTPRVEPSTLRVEPTGEPGGPGPEPAGVPAAADGTVISVVATVNLTRSTGRIEYVHPVPNSTPTAPDPDSPYALRVLTAAGAVLAEVPVPVKPSSDEDVDQDRTGLVDAVLAAGAGAAAVELRHGDRVLDTYRSAGAPAPSRGRVNTDLSGSEIVVDLGRQVPPGHQLPGAGQHRQRPQVAYRRSGPAHAAGGRRPPHHGPRPGAADPGHGDRRVHQHRGRGRDRPRLTAGGGPDTAPGRRRYRHGRAGPARELID
jgi:hypothetical protein